jgi:acetylornithine/succinyldiaminopimelate/putrescine aminotransferase
LFYLRFFLHAVPEDVQETLLSVITECARPGDMFAAEFRSEADQERAKTHTKHYRRFQNGPAFGVALHDRYGFAVLDEVEGTGLAVYGDEDPVIYRVIARFGS